MYTRPKEGLGQDMTVNFHAVVGIDDNAKLIDGAELGATIPALGTDMSAAGDYQLLIELDISGRSSTDTGNMIQNAVGAKVSSFISDGATVADVTPLAGYEFNLVGYVPYATRSNANFRQRGVQIETGTTQKYCLPVELRAPISTKAPVQTEGYAISMEGLNKAHRILRANSAVSSILEIEAMLASGIAAGTGISVAAGANVVKPTYYSFPVDLTSLVLSNDSTGSYQDMREALLNAITTMSQRLFINSRYSAALEAQGLTSADYEVVIGTDPFLASLVMESGDSRALGNKVPFRVAVTNDERMLGKVKIAFRRKGGDAADILNFGVQGFVPALVFEGEIARGNTLSKEMIVQPRFRHHVLCPVLGNLDVTGHERLFLEVPPTT